MGNVGERAPARAAVLDAGLRPDRGQDHRSAARYSALDGSQEDVVDILLNLKGVVMKLHNRDHVV